MNRIAIARVKLFGVETTRLRAQGNGTDQIRDQTRSKISMERDPGSILSSHDFNQYGIMLEVGGNFADLLVPGKTYSLQLVEDE